MSASEAKRDLVTEGLMHGLVSVLVNPALPGVRLPEYLMDHPSVVINLSWQFKVRIELLEDGVYADLSFQNSDFPVVLPWSAVWGVRIPCGDLCVFPDAMPPGIAIHQDTEPEPKPEPPKPRHLKLVN